MDSRGWRWKKKGFFDRQPIGRRVQRYRCSHCARCFSSQTFSPTYWLRRPDLPRALFLRLLSCSAYRQIARDLSISPTTVLRHTERLGRHCLLWHRRLCAALVLEEPVVLDGFASFEFSQYTPVDFHTAVLAGSHFFLGFTDSELRRKGRMTPAQKARRKQLETRLGCPDPKSVEIEVAALLEIVIPPGTRAEVLSDEHPAYPRALRRVEPRVLRHAVTPSTDPRTPQNPLFPVNLLDLLIRHSSANHKRETIAFSKRRQHAAYRLWILLVWRNAMKSFSERRRDATPAQRMGLLPRRLHVEDVLAQRLFPSRIALPERWARYYWAHTPTRRIPNIRVHRAKYAA